MRLPGRRASSLWIAVFSLAGLAIAGCGFLPVPEVPISTVAPPREPPLDLPEPGRPYTAEQVLQKMRAMPAPDPDDPEALGLDPALVTPAIAAAIADQLYTFDGQPYVEWSIGGACDPRVGCIPGSTARLGVGGLSEFLGRDRERGFDSHAFRVDISTSIVVREGWPVTTLTAYPADLEPALDRLARSATGHIPEDMKLFSGYWLEPPATGQFLLDYRASDPASARFVLLDARRGVILWIRTECGDCQIGGTLIPTLFPPRSDKQSDVPTTLFRRTSTYR